MVKHNNEITQRELLLEYFQSHPNKDIKHPEIVDWATSEYKKRTSNVFRDPDRSIRLLHQEGYLIKVTKGVYRYDPKHIVERELEDFTPAQKQTVFERDGYKCVVCGRGTKEGFELHIDHIKPKDFGGEATIENGQTLCSQHNFMKKNLKQTETGKKMFIRLYEVAKHEGNKALLDFCTQILDVYEKNNINCHIKWER
ncbi:HNH endonuclease [candidate division TA06 bacterium]|uniref:HNH endonuclease n=1 Tax=candidate division TA06 bacterium TaxID=2250710 RepID=A0A933I780_UNCT6|nr:HNH endonuclease [candidate division TA06 bacterium]